ncbi:hypothetical protein ACHAXA_007535 [Cyclostephanos tholiformis]|uniref:DNA-directed primase/polymerase protein n=1 Tax=Cyclostephanos tholiformis TaxID=382380 RepID=A0ABD3SRX7_9STRA
MEGNCYDVDRWRCDSGSKKSTPTVNTEKAKSNGIDPSSFYNNNNPCTDERLTAILRVAAHNEVIRKRCEYTSIQKLRRNAYREVTRFKIFPLQDLAFDFFTEMQKERRRITDDDYIIDDDKGVVFDDLKRPSLSSNGKRRKLEKCGDDDIEKTKLISRFQTDNTELWSMEPRIFAAETSLGKRKYIVGNMGRFLQHYWRETDPISRHFYELIPEGTPCRLYFDLEYAKEINQITHDESEMLMTEFIDELCSEFQSTYSITLSRSCIVDLDSSTEKKFSRHLIIHLPNGELFADAISVGLFVKRFVGRLAEELSTGALEGRRAILAKHLFVNKRPPKSDVPALKSEYSAEHDTDASTKHGFDHKESICFVDLGVYSRNRLFRLMGSTKFGQDSSAALRIAKANLFPFPTGFDNSKFYLPLRAKNASSSSFTFSEGHDSKHDRDRNYEAFCASLDWEMHACALVSTLVVPTDICKKNATILMGPENDSECLVKPKDSLIASRRKLPCRTSYGASPIQTLDNFIVQKLSTRGGIQGKIRAWSMERGDQYISYHMSENRWCENIGRAHKSNNVIWNFDLKCRTYWQTCYDIECRAANFRGKISYLPAEVASDVSDYLIDQELATVDIDQIISRDMPAEVTNDVSDYLIDQELAAIDVDRITREAKNGSGGSGLASSDSRLQG